MVGKIARKVSNHWKKHEKKFQSLEKLHKKVPMVGKIEKKLSNDWKLPSGAPLCSKAHFYSAPPPVCHAEITKKPVFVHLPRKS